MSTLLADSLTAQDVCNDASCAAATSHRDTCECSCAGNGHGGHHRAGIARAVAAHVARPDRQVSGFTRAMLAAAPSDEAW